MYSDFRDDWLSKLGKSMQMPQLHFDEEGLCQLTLNQEFVVTMHKVPDSDYLVLFGQIPMEPIAPALIQKMLLENRNSARCAAPVLSIAQNLDAIEAHLKLTQSELIAIGDVLGLLVDNLEYWRNHAIS
jgi:hypothetical protein